MFLQNLTGECEEWGWSKKAMAWFCHRKWLISWFDETQLLRDETTWRQTELIWIELTATSTPTFIDHQIKAHFSLDKFSHSLLCSPDNSLIYLCGDFNLPGINWNNQDMIGTTSKTEFSLYQMVSKPTCGSYILDLLFTNNDSTCGPMCDPWHTSLFNQPTQNAIQFESKEVILQFRKADFALFREFISAISWGCCFLHGTIDTGLTSTT